MNRKATLLVCLVILAAGAAATTLIFSTEPRATRSGAVRKSAMLVDVVEVRRGAHRPDITATGVVEASQDVVLSPRVSGEVLSRAKAFTPGGYVSRGDVLLRVDPADYEAALQQARSELSQAQAALHMEEGRQRVAEQDYRLLADSLNTGSTALVLREPQLESARSRVQSAEAAVRRAELDLERTRVKAPFDAHVISREVSVGSQVAPGDNLGRLVGLDTYWVSITVPLSRLRWLTLPEDGQGPGSEVVIRNRTAWGEDQHRLGRLYRLVGALEDRTRMARVLAEVSDPLALAADADVPPLIIGSFVEVSIQGEEISDAVRLERDYIRDDSSVWVMQDGALDVRSVEVVVQDARYAYVTDGLEDGDLVVTTNLSTVVDGAPLRTADEEAP